MTTEPTLLIPPIPDTKQTGLVMERELTIFQRIRPGAEPAGLAEGLHCWRAEDVEILRSRKAWKKRNLRLPLHTPPAREVMIEGRLQPVYAESQTLTEEGFLLSQKDRIAERCQGWNGEWQGLREELADWQQRLPDLAGDEAERELLEQLQERLTLIEQRQGLAKNAAILKLTLDPLGDQTPWREAIRRYREHRLQRVIQDRDDPELAVLVDREFTAREKADPDHLELLPFWQYFNNFRKALETARLEEEAAAATRIREFHLLFPARWMSRRFTLYLGPTNSGKTYQALRRLAEVGRGIYLAPLRLLALEVADTLTEWGVPCSMITGEERNVVAGAQHTASTIEMLPLNAKYDMCVIDEAQMLGDPDRGWAWTQAILGVQADEVCVIGAPESRPIIEKLLRLTGDPYQVVELDRLTPLRMLEQPVLHYYDLEPGTALVAFSRSAVLAMKGALERKTGQRVAVLYGALPPEVRRQQAHLFATGEATFLVATDAIGMGLNLPIRTLLFAEDRKFINRQELPLTPTTVRQIAGRAGRFGKNEIGWVGTFRIPIHAIRDAFLREPDSVTLAHLAPNLEHLLAMDGLREQGKPSLTRLFNMFRQRVKPDPEVYRMSDLEDQTVLARIADQYAGLALETRFSLSAAPVPLRSLQAVSAYSVMVESVARGRKLSISGVLPQIQFRREARLGTLETAMQVVNIYSWLHYRFADLFPDLPEAASKRREINLRINELLGRKATLEGEALCMECHQPLPPQHRYPICDACWTGGRKAAASQTGGVRPPSPGAGRRGPIRRKQRAGG